MLIPAGRERPAGSVLAPPPIFTAWPNNWFARNSSKGWATCPLVEASFVRILSNPAFSPRAVSTQEALEALTINTKHPQLHFRNDELSLTQAGANLKPRAIGHQQVTDAYLLAFAVHRGGKLATLDKRLGNLMGSGRERDYLEIIQ